MKVDGRLTHAQAVLNFASASSKLVLKPNTYNVDRSAC